MLWSCLLEQLLWKPGAAEKLHFRWGMGPEVKLLFNAWWSPSLGGLVAGKDSCQARTARTWQCKDSCQVRGQRQSTGRAPGGVTTSRKFGPMLSGKPKVLEPRGGQELLELVTWLLSVAALHMPWIASFWMPLHDPTQGSQPSDCIWDLSPETYSFFLISSWVDQVAYMVDDLWTVSNPMDSGPCFHGSSSPSHIWVLPMWMEGGSGEGHFIVPFYLWRSAMVDISTWCAAFSRWPDTDFPC